MNIFNYKIQLVITKNGINERAIIKEVNRRVPKNALHIQEHIQRIKIIRELGKYFPADMLNSDGIVGLRDAKDFADLHWKRNRKS